MLYHPDIPETTFMRTKGRMLGTAFCKGRIVWEKIRCGGFYDWGTVSNANFAPSGWHLPTEEDFATLILEAENNARKIKSMHYWTDGAGYEGTNELGFNMYPNGYAQSDSGVNGFLGLLSGGMIWSADSTNVEFNGLWIEANSNTINYGNKLIPPFGDMVDGMGVRFVKDNTTMPTGNVVADYEGNVYRCANIGGLIWTLTNWRSRKFFNGDDLNVVPDNWEERGVGQSVAWYAIDERLR